MSWSCGLWGQVGGSGNNLALFCTSLSEELAWLYAPAILMFIPTSGPDAVTMTCMSRNHEQKETPASLYVVSIMCFLTAMRKVIYTSLVSLWVNTPKLCFFATWSSGYLCSQLLRKIYVWIQGLVYLYKPYRLHCNVITCAKVLLPHRFRYRKIGLKHF